MQKELDRKSDECVQLRSALSNQTVNLKSLASSNYGSDVDIVNEDGELATAYEAQKEINKQLQEELLSEKKFYSEHISKCKADIDRLREDNEQYQKQLQEELLSEKKFYSEHISKCKADIDRLREDNEQYQKQLQEELLSEKKFYSEHISKCKADIDRLREDNEQYQKQLQEELLSEKKFYSEHISKCKADIDRLREDNEQYQKQLQEELLSEKKFYSEHISKCKADIDRLREDNEQYQKQLQEELLSEKKFYSEHISKCKADIDRLREDNEQYQKQLQEELLSEKKFYSEHISKCKADIDRLREDNEQYQKQLQEELLSEKKFYSEHISKCKADIDRLREDNEQYQKQLQEELLSEKKFYSEHISKCKADIDRLREDNEQYQKLLSEDLSAEPKNKEQVFAQNEIKRLAAESLSLQEHVDRLSESCRRYKNQIRMLVDKLKEVGIEDVNDILESNDSIVPRNANMSLEMAPATRKKEREYLGMFEYKVQDVEIIIKKLVKDLKPKIAVGLLPGLPAYIMFMMLRHMDHVDEESKMHQLMMAIHTGVTKTLKERAGSVEYNALWLANMLRLLNNLKQYSGDAVYQTDNTPRQTQQCLRIFDLSEYREVLSDTAVRIYRDLINLLERQLERLIVPAILEHEEISGLLGSVRAPAASPNAGPSRLTRELTTMHEHLHTYHMDESLRVTIIKQLFYYICAYSLNKLLLRKDLCCWAKGLLIRYNISHLEAWIEEHLAEYGQKNVEDILSVLRPITQAVQMLQARKSMQDVQSTVEMCSNLTAKQVRKILNMYTPTPAERYEVKVTQEFIHEIHKKLQEKAGHNPDKEPQNLLMDTKMIFTVQFPFNPSSIRLEDIELPSVLELDGFLTKI